jgi:hypothetical protein
LFLAFFDFSKENSVLAVTHSFRKFWTALQKKFEFLNRGFAPVRVAHQGAAVFRPPRFSQSGRVVSTVQVRSAHETHRRNEKKSTSEIFRVPSRLSWAEKKRRSSTALQNACVIRVIRGGLSEDNNKWPLLLL